MRIQKFVLVALVISITGILSACSSEQKNIETSAIQTESSVVETETEQITTETSNIDFSTYTALLGMPDEDTAELFGTGMENWTEDRSFYIGRIYDISLNGEDCSLYTTCDRDKIVSSVSIWLSDGKRELRQGEVEQWVKQLSDFTGNEPAFYDSASSEGGSKSWKWSYDQTFLTLHLLGNILTLDMNPAVGELR